MRSLAEYLARPEVLSLPPFDISANANDQFGPDAIKLDANESPFRPLVGEASRANVNRYPEPQPLKLRAALSALYGVAADELVITRGADDAIDVLVRTFCRPRDDSIAISSPTFAAYEHFARLQGARVIDVPLVDEFRFDPARFIRELVRERSLKLAFICTPNNPTGVEVEPAAILEVAEGLANTIVVVDEAYLEFSSTPSLAAEAARRPNLVVLKTLSKAFGLAGARVGAAIGTRDLIALASRVLPPYPLPSLSIDAAIAALEPSRRTIYAERISVIKAERERVAALLSSSPHVKSVRNGGGNFLFLEVEDPDGLARELRRRGIRVRFRPKAAPGGVRLTIGTEAENDAALAAFGIAAKSAVSRRSDLVRDTSETRVALSIDLDRPNPRKVETGIGFFDHMLDQIAAHAGFSLLLSCTGDLEIDAHHTIEDCAIVLGKGLSAALGDRRAIGRFGFTLPMDEAEAAVLVDLSGRPFVRFEGEFTAEKIGDYPTQMTAHVFRSLADNLGATIHVRVEGENDHHKAEACFKAFGRALRQAIRQDADTSAIPSTKGTL